MTKVRITLSNSIGCELAAEIVEFPDTEDLEASDVLRNAMTD